MIHNPIIVAIDTTDIARAKQLCAELKGHVGAVKLGLEFFTAHGAVGVREVMPEGLPLFLDLKFHDIPNTVGKAIRALKGLDISMLTIHTSGGVSMMQAARDAADWLGEQGGTRPKVLGVTVLTSLDESDMEKIGVQLNVAKQVEKLATLAQASGLDGVVCSPQEIQGLRQSFATSLRGGSASEAIHSASDANASNGSPRSQSDLAMTRDMLLVVPGIRPTGSATGDQKRTMTPKEALAAGADYLVIGRPITEAANPLEVIKTLQS